MSTCGDDPLTQIGGQERVTSEPIDAFEFERYSGPDIHDSVELRDLCDRSLAHYHCARQTHLPVDAGQMSQGRDEALRDRDIIALDLCLVRYLLILASSIDDQD